MEWIIHLGFQNVVFESNVKTVVDATRSTLEDVIEFRSWLENINDSWSLKIHFLCVMLGDKLIIDYSYFR